MCCPITNANIHNLLIILILVRVKEGVLTEIREEVARRQKRTNPEVGWS